MIGIVTVRARTEMLALFLHKSSPVADIIKQNDARSYRAPTWTLYCKMILTRNHSTYKYGAIDSGR